MFFLFFCSVRGRGSSRRREGGGGWRLVHRGRNSQQVEKIALQKMPGKPLDVLDTLQPDIRKELVKGTHSQGQAEPHSQYFFRVSPCVEIAALDFHKKKNVWRFAENLKIR